MTPAAEIETQCAAIRAVLARSDLPFTAGELRDALSAGYGSLPWLTVETIQRRLNRMAGSGRVTIYERAGPRGQHCYEAAREMAK